MARKREMEWRRSAKKISRETDGLAASGFERDFADTLSRRLTETLSEELPESGVIEEKIQVVYEEIRRKGQEKKKPGFYRWRNMAAAVALLLLLPVTGYAAAKYWSLQDFLAGAGMEDTAAVTGAATEMLEGYAFSNQYVNYTIKEALCDEELIYIIVEAVSREEKNLLIPQYCEGTDSVSELGIAGVEGQTIQEYADAQGKALLHSSVGLFREEELVSCTEAVRGQTDGTVYYCITGVNPFDTEKLILTCVGTAYTRDMPVADRAECQFCLFNNSTAAVREYQMADDGMAEDAGIGMDSIELSETELGLYVTFHFHRTQAALAEESPDFALVDEKGRELAPMPYYAGSGILDLGGGAYSEKLAYQKGELNEKLFVRLRNLEDGTVYGTYEITEK